MFDEAVELRAPVNLYGHYSHAELKFASLSEEQKAS